jgi:anti-sigma regulatory factor (Ser/Thr protein kinase)
MDSAARFELTMSGSIEDLRQAGDRLAHFLVAEGVGAEPAYALETAFEEFATNVIKYGFREGGSHWIKVGAAKLPDRIELLIEDDGKAFDPTQAPRPTTARPLEEMPVGGLGIHLARSLTSGIEYERERGVNRVRVWVAQDGC